MTDAEADLSMARRLDRAGRRIRVLVLVKATPQLSMTYGDTVCVAGLAISPGPLRWVRLYPVPFRHMDGERQFSKYMMIDVTVRDASGDKRAESLKIDAQSIELGPVLKGWGNRSAWVETAVGPTMCEVLRAVRADMNSISLAAVRPRAVDPLEFKPHPGWSDTELARFRAWSDKGDLFRTRDPKMLEPPRLIVHVPYHCLEPGCGGHKQRNIDWELTAFQWRYRDRPEAELRALIEKNFYENMFGPGKRPLIYVGNQENVQRRRSFVTLGAYYPPAEAVEGPALF
ncbi:hypothetical protein [Miniimonas sp. S16]|uniref:hypothetical protein n=1 Tax=Miniimonas sp. S16 TaxID=2171623 RepID=UPI000D5299CA|nr:hypothetical protein [Miniimonas sp. S16]